MSIKKFLFILIAVQFSYAQNSDCLILNKTSFQNSNLRLITYDKSPVIHLIIKYIDKEDIKPVNPLILENTKVNKGISYELDLIRTIGIKEFSNETCDCYTVDDFYNRRISAPRNLTIYSFDDYTVSIYKAHHNLVNE